MAVSYSPFTIHYLLWLPARGVVASTTAAAITTTAATAAAIATITAATTATAAASTTIFAWSGFVDGQVTTGQVSAVKLFDCFLTVFFGSHFDETKTA